LVLLSAPAPAPQPQCFPPAHLPNLDLPGRCLPGLTVYLNSLSLSFSFSLSLSLLAPHQISHTPGLCPSGPSPTGTQSRLGWGCPARHSCPFAALGLLRRLDIQIAPYDHHILLLCMQCSTKKGQQEKKVHGSHRSPTTDREQAQRMTN
jgi:hypothetical protein